MEHKLNNVLFASQLRRAPQISASSPASHGPARPFRFHDAAFEKVTGPSPGLRLLASTDKSVGGCERSYFHEAGVYVPNRDRSSRGGSSSPKSAESPGDVYITSNILRIGDEMEEAVTIEVCKLSLPPDDDGTSSPRTDLSPSHSDSGVFVAHGVRYEAIQEHTGALVMANGGTAYGSDVLFCCQGQDHLIPKHLSEFLDPSAPFIPSALVQYNPRDSSTPPRQLLNNFNGRVFNSLNDVVFHPPSKCIFFTDPDYGFEQRFKSTPQLPNAVWRFNPQDGSVGMVADGLQKPNGIVFSPDGKTCYVTDTDFIHGDGDMDGRRAATIYAYDVRTPSRGPPHLHSKRVFAFVDCGAPDGIKCDTVGNVYTGCFDGVHVFAPSGLLIGKILLPPDAEGNQRGCANLVFGPPGRLIILSETTVWEARIAAVGDLKGVQ